MSAQSSQSEAAICLEGVSLGSERSGTTDPVLLEKASLRVGRAEAVCLRGPSGCGKSSLLFLMAGLLKPLSGSVEIFGVDLSSLPGRLLRGFRRKHLHLMPQSLEMFPHLSVLENLAAVQFIQGVPDWGAAKNALKSVGLLDKWDFKPMQLSGGERQRACLARALVSRAPICLLDEPTSNLDSESALQAVRLLEKERQKGKTLVVATQDSAFAALNGRQLRVEHRRLAESGTGI